MSQLFLCLTTTFIHLHATQNDIYVHYFSYHSPERLAKKGSLKAQFRAAQKQFTDRAIY